MQKEKYVIHKNFTRIYHDYRVGYQSIIRNNASFKYETTFKGMYEIVQTWTNRTVTLKMGAVTTRIKIQRINPYRNSVDAE